MRILTEKPVFTWLQRAVTLLTRRRYILNRTFNAKHRPRLILDGCHCTPGERHALHSGRRLWPVTKPPANPDPPETT
jgi:hypothetical protein